MCVHLQADPLYVGPPIVEASHPCRVVDHVEHVRHYHDDSDGEDDINGDEENDGSEDNDKKLLRELGFLTWIRAKRPFQTKFSLPEQKKLFLQLLVEPRVERKHLEGGEAEDRF